MKLKNTFLALTLLTSLTLQAKINLTSDELTEVCLEGANLNGKDLDGKNLTKANLDSTSLVDTSFVGATLINASLVTAEQKKTDFSGANLTGANLSDSHGYVTQIQKVITAITMQKIKAACVEQLECFKTWSYWQQLPKTTYHGCVRAVQATLPIMNKQKASRAKVNYSGAKLIDAKLDNVILMQPNFNGANLHGAYLAGSIISFGTFKNVTSMRCCNLRNCLLFGSDFTGANFEDALVEGADFYGTTGLDAEQISYLEDNGAKNVPKSKTEQRGIRYYFMAK